MNRRTVAIALDIALVGVCCIYLIGLNPTTIIYLKNHATAMRYKAWQLTHPAWMREAMKVRGLLQDVDT